MHDEVNSLLSLNCRTFSENCKWSNTNEEELDWTTLQALPDAERFLSTLEVENYPDLASGVLASNSRPGWEGGQLISDPIPCLPNGIRVAATAWRSRIGSINEQPKLQARTFSIGTDSSYRFYLFRNGVPLTVDVPSANDPNEPAQIVFYGNNFVAALGGAIFLQDIVFEGRLSCNSKTDTHPILMGDDVLQGRAYEERHQTTVYTPQPQSVKPLKIMEELSGLEVLADKSSTLDRSSEKSMSPSNSISSQIEEDLLADLQPDSLKAVIPITSTSSPTNSLQIPSQLFETCLALSCNPSDLNCKFWRSSGENRWEIGSADRITNPLTGIHVPPSSAQKFLVAPFLDAHATSYTLVSESLTVPHMEPVFFCFHDYIATHGLRLSICTDNMDCFYKKDTLLLGNAVDENKKWNIHCVKLPIGKYELRVMAENLGGNKGEVGFLPIRLSRDPAGQEFIC
ncbi:unnamed protein product [Angiostrongylus costaricensis]|uniref:MAM domain-containing protein n=1 Tax=Angiostrongylus costaricensis TaxID=334426 RepID=A0A0R3PS06_ANGCS|nr:unnamed protein product [Angiostrongylus costaricensis]